MAGPVGGGNAGGSAMEVHDGNTPGSGMSQPGGAGATGNVTDTQGGGGIDDLFDRKRLASREQPLPGPIPRRLGLRQIA